MTIEERYWQQLFALLVSNSPYDTFNMRTHITLGTGDTNEFIINIEAPYKDNPKSKKPMYNGKSDYAWDVNYNPRKSTYQWVEREVNSAAKIINGYQIYIMGSK